MQIKQHTDFLGKRGLLEAFAEFIRPKTIREKLESHKREISRGKDHSKVKTIERNRRNDLAI